MPFSSPKIFWSSKHFLIVRLSGLTATADGANVAEIPECRHQRPLITSQPVAFQSLGIAGIGLGIVPAGEMFIPLSI